MLLAQMEAFIEIARLGNMRRAARTLSLSQPALTARIQASRSKPTDSRER